MRFLSAILRYILALQDSEFTSTSLNSVFEIIKFVEGFCSTCLSYSEIFEVVNFFLLQLSYRFFRASSLEKRVLSLLLLNKVLVNIINFSNPVPNNNNNQQKGSKPSLVRKDEMDRTTESEPQSFLDLQ